MHSIVIENEPAGLGQRVIARLRGIDRLFLVTVAIPTLLSSLYFGLIASDVYISESRFVVRSPSHQQQTGLGALLQGAGFSHSEEDTYMVHDFMQSRDALAELDKQIGLAHRYEAPDIDVFSRFGALGGDTNFEELYQYYQKHVQIDMETASAISTLKVRAYTAEDAYRTNELLLEMSERLINQLNARGRQDMIGFAQAEVDAAAKKAKDAALALSDFRHERTVVDPEKQSTLQLQQVTKLQDELMAANTQMAQFKTFTPDNPQIAALQTRIETLKGLISAESEKITGSGDSLTQKAADYQRLQLESNFADKQLAVALSSLEQARDDAVRKQLYLERVVQPNKPDVPREPKRLRGVITTLALGMIAWGILAILLAGVREHKG